VFKRKRASKTSVVGLELDPGHVAAAEVHVNGSLTLQRGAVAHLRPGILRDGDVTDPTALTDTLRTLFEEHDLPRRVRLGIANQRIVVRTLDVPVMEDEKALLAAVRLQAPDQIPMPIDEAILDMQPLGTVQTVNGPRARVVVVAVRREMVERVVGAVRDAGLELEGLDLSAFGMVRAVDVVQQTGRAVLFVNAAGLVNVAVANEAGCLFTRAASGGVDAMAVTLSERRGLTFEHARQWMMHVGLATPLEQVDGDAELVAAARSALDEGVHQIADTVRNSLNFYRMQESAEAVDRAVLTGPCVDVPGLPERLSELLRMPVEAFTVQSGEGVADAGRLTVAAGLAVAERP
jgi:type IV pilus assembly protein PilM